jgi:hypothetical protein
VADADHVERQVPDVLHRLSRQKGSGKMVEGLRTLTDGVITHQGVAQAACPLAHVSQESPKALRREARREPIGCAQTGHSKEHPADEIVPRGRQAFAEADESLRRVQRGGQVSCIKRVADGADRRKANSEER